MKRKKAHVDKNYCVACGVCAKNCPLNIIKIKDGIYAEINIDKCVGCGTCAKACPTSVIEVY